MAEEEEEEIWEEVEEVLTVWILRCISSGLRFYQIH